MESKKLKTGTGEQTINIGDLVKDDMNFNKHKRMDLLNKYDCTNFASNLFTMVI